MNVKTQSIVKILPIKLYICSGCGVSNQSTKFTKHAAMDYKILPS